MMTANRVGKLSEGFGLGFGVMPSTENVHEQLRGSYSWGGFWSTSFRISPRGDWVVIALAQVAPNDEAFQWPDRYEKIAAEAILKNPAPQYRISELARLNMGHHSEKIAQ